MEVPTLKPLSEDQARFYFQDLIKGIEYRKRGACGRILTRGWLAFQLADGKWESGISLLECKQQVGGKQNCLKCSLGQL